MGFLNRLFGKPAPKKENEIKEQPTVNESPIIEPIKTEKELFESYAAYGFEKQLDFTELIEDKSWDADLTRGTISFGEGFEFPLQIIGSFSYSVNTWLWSWANSQSNLPESLLEDAKILKEYGVKNKIDQLRTPEFPIKQDELHRLGLIAVGMFDADAYYLADYGSGIMLMTVKSDTIQNNRKDNHHRIFTTFPQVISNFEVDHKNTLTHYLKSKGYEIDESENQIVGTKGNDKCRATLDSLNRIVHLGG
ncbi:hypothetical protein SMI01S_34050 [Sphingobacterium mizutaii NBRC 14946 = DSM 11724]|uniref:Uncharacterized protein n=2 Tax=Sphingobacterium mizutaii TaxID=1010 RepID=A0AAJ5BZQ2_9SPHI|nr:DUF6882 domain-containing protein [Sphingobacterium mizutaii]GEM69799.1 hypothetical protein SMI01S_34050 [Sphingobacterium mizutaii NBRC 14946 = DSM 11724]SDK90507.1 hypothetical protein SAMN05192578_101251 [Sphingobacterium mizutaii]SNV47353.1 Uncharacterised protein [Sphingobacterium mizutaii]